VADISKEKNEDYESDDEEVPEQPVAEEEDLSRADMYLDTVSPKHEPGHNTTDHVDIPVEARFRL
jgi:hypothetical protein